MTKRAQLADGTILEFPADTPDDVMDKVVRQHISGQAAPQEQPATPPANGIPNPAAPVWNPQTGQQDSTANVSPGGMYDAQGKPLPPDWNGDGEVFDAQGKPMLDVVDSAPWPTDNTASTPMESLGAVGGAMFRGLAALPDMALDARDALFPNLQTDRSRFSDIPDMMGTKRPSAPGIEFAGNVLGGMVVPGPKGRPMNALAPQVEQAAAKPVNALAGDARGIIEAGKREGVRVMTSDVSPPKTAISKFIQKTGESIPLTGTAGPRAAQQGERIKAVENLLAEYGATEAKGAANEIAADLVATRGAAIKSLTKAKNSVIDTLPGKVPTPNASKVINEQITRLRGINEEAFAPVIAKLKNFEAQLESGLTLSQVEGNRRLLGDLFADPSLASIKGDGQKALNAIYGPLREDMGAFIKQVGGEGQFNKWKGANDRLAAMAGELDASAFKGALNKAETTPEAAAKLLFSKTPSDVKRLYKNLSPQGRVKAQSAIIHEAMTRAGGAENLSPQKFATAMKAMDDATGIFFAPADKARIDGLTRLLQATQRASEAGALPMTGAQNTIPIIGASLTGLFGGAGGLASAGTIGLAARVYESAPVRDALLRIGRSKPGSPQEQAAVAGAEKIIARYMAKAAPVTADRIGQAVSQSPAPRAAAEDQNK